MTLPVSCVTNHLHKKEVLLGTQKIFMVVPLSVQTATSRIHVMTTSYFIGKSAITV